MKPRAKPIRSLLALAFLLGLGAAAEAQSVLLPPLEKPAPAADLVEAAPSKVFPDGGFPETTAPEGGIPAPTTKPGPGVSALGLPLSPADYAPPGRYPRDYQDAPGADYLYRPVTTGLPKYYYEQSYYDRPIISPRSALIYAPPGYEARDQQVGPGSPEFTPITAPLPITPEEREKFVTRGILPGSFLVPGTNTSFRMRGFVRLMGLYDFNPIGSRDSFVPNTIPVPQTRGENYNMSARMSRIAFETWTPTSVNEWNVHTFIEGDFFNGPGQAAGGGGNPFRLRHAFIDWGYFRVGQQNTVFMDASTWPSLVDFQGPAGWVNQRRPGLRVTLPVADKLFVAGGIEQPFSDITTNGNGDNVQDVPDFAAHLRYEGDNGHVQVAGLARSIGWRPAGGSATRQAGYGLSAGTTFHPWAILNGTNSTRQANPTGLERSRIIGQYTVGRGITRYLQDTVGMGLDAQVGPVDSSFESVYAAAWVLSYEHWYSERWMSAVTWSETLVGSNTGQAANTYIGGKYFTANVWYIPVGGLSLGLEYIYGERENINSLRGSARRVNALVQYNF